MAILRKKSIVLYPELSYKIIGLCFNIHNRFGRFRSENQYADALEQLLKESKILHQREVPLGTSFTGERPGRNIPDFIINNQIVIDLKAKLKLTKNDYYQMQRYLIVSNKRLGIIVNFRRLNLQPKRILNSDYSQ